MIKLALLLTLFVVSGTSMPLLLQVISINGGCESSTLLANLPSSVGMIFPILFSGDFLGTIHWHLVALVVAIETISQIFIMDGLLLAGSAIYTIAYSSVTIYTAIFATIFLHHRMHFMQWIGLVIVVVGLALVAVGAKAEGDDIALGVLFILFGSLSHSVVYILSEYLLKHTINPIKPEFLCFLLGVSGTFVNLCWQTVYTYPNRQNLIVNYIESHHGSVQTIKTCYITLVICSAVHSLCFYNLLSQLGSTSTGLCKGVQSVAVFIASDFAFCQYQTSQCFTVGKASSLVVVTAGVLVYSYYGMKSSAAPTTTYSVIRDGDKEDDEEIGNVEKVVIKISK